MFILTSGFIASILGISTDLANCKHTPSGYKPSQTKNIFEIKFENVAINPSERRVKSSYRGPFLVNLTVILVLTEYPQSRNSSTADITSSASHIDSNL